MLLLVLHNITLCTPYLSSIYRLYKVEISAIDKVLISYTLYFSLSTILYIFLLITSRLLVIIFCKILLYNNYYLIEFS